MHKIVAENVENMKNVKKTLKNRVGGGRLFCIYDVSFLKI